MVVKKSSTELVDQNVTVLANNQGMVVLKLSDKQALLVTAATTLPFYHTHMGPPYHSTIFYPNPNPNLQSGLKHRIVDVFENEPAITEP